MVAGRAGALAMRARWVWNLGALAAFGGVGCTPPGPNLKTPAVEQFTLPPTDDGRFSNPPAFPKEVMNQDNSKSSNGSLPKLPSQMPSVAPGGNRFGGPPGGGF
jgi:hypothetical protein